VGGGVRRVSGRCRFRGTVRGQLRASRPSARRGRPTREGSQAIGRSRGGLATKIHAVVEALGNLARWRLTAGQAVAVTEAEPRLEGIPAEAVAADKAYDPQALIDSTTRRGAQALIRPRGNRTEPCDFDRRLYKGRNLVERFFCRIKHFRRVVARYDELDCRYREFSAIAAAWLWLASLRQQYLARSWFKAARRKQLDFGFHFGGGCAEPVSDRYPLTPVIAACFGLHMFRWLSAGWFTERKCDHL
jgi:transposase